MEVGAEGRMDRSKRSYNWNPHGGHGSQIAPSRPTLSDRAYRRFSGDGVGFRHGLVWPWRLLEALYPFEDDGRGRGAFEWNRLWLVFRLRHDYLIQSSGDWRVYRSRGSTRPNPHGHRELGPVLYSAPPIPAGILQESTHSSGIPVESTGIPLEFHWNKTGI